MSFHALDQQYHPAYPLEDLTEHPANPRRGDDEAVAESVEASGFYGAIIVQASTGHVLAGNTRLRVARAAGAASVPVFVLDVDDEQAVRIMLGDNRLSDLAAYDDDALLAALQGLGGDLSGTGYTEDDLADLVAALAKATVGDSMEQKRAAAGSLADRFLVAPVSVLNARSGEWMERKRLWRARGLQDAEGRVGGLTYSGSNRFGDMYEHKRRVENLLGRDLSVAEAEGYLERMATNDLAKSGTSAFDPALAEVLLAWYSPSGGRVLDPFAGGPTRGMVSAWMGRTYTGVDLRPEQVDHNRQQAATLLAGDTPAVPADSSPGDVSPVERYGNRWVKREDLFVIAGSAGGKVRSCWHLASQPGVRGLVTAGSRHSPQANIVAGIARRLGIPCRIHTAAGAATPEMAAAAEAGAEIIRHKPGYNTVLVARAREDAAALAAEGWVHVPFGMEHQAAVEQTAAQVVNIPDEVARVVVPVGSGMSLAGILHGLQQIGSTVPVLGVVVGADPTSRLDTYAPADWRTRCTLVEASVPYDTAVDAAVAGVRLDPHYEAKCAEHLRDGDLLWIVGCRETARRTPLPTGPVPRWVVGDSTSPDTWAAVDAMDAKPYDMVLTCPPYADLEVYSEDPADLSNVGVDGWDTGQAAALAEACSRLVPGGFAAVVIGEARGGKANSLYGLVGRTQAHLEAAGCDLWAHYVMLTPIGGARLSVARQFGASRSPARVHQHVLVARRRGGPTRVADQWGVLAGVEDALATLQPEDGDDDSGVAN